MRRKAIQKIKAELKDKKVEMLNRLMKGRSDYLENLKNEGGDLADEATETIERELIYDLSVTEKKEVEEIDTALNKIEEGTYGICESCNQEIPLGRLKVKPYAKFCMKCQEVHERNERHHPMGQIKNEMTQEENE